MRRTLVKQLGDPVTFYATHCGRKWWVSTIASYAQLRIALRGEGLHSHHLIPKSLFLHGPAKTRGLIDYVPSIPFTEAEHLKTLHPALNEILRDRGLWQKRLSCAQLREAIRLTAHFYKRHGLNHFADAIRQFLKHAYDKAT